jgi:chromosome segregation ATPase
VGSIPDEFAKLEEAVRGLVGRHRRLAQENAELRRAVAQRDQSIRALEGRILEQNQRRQDVAKRVDELIVEIQQLEDRLGVAEKLDV